MKRFNIFCWILLLVLMCFAVPLTAAELKIGFVNFQHVLNEAPQAKAVRLRMENDFSSRKKKIDTMVKALQKLEKDLSKQGSFMTKEGLNKHERKIILKQRNIKHAKEEFKEELNIQRNQAVAELQRLIINETKEYAKNNGFDLVIADAVMFASSKVDITESILQRLKDLSKTNSGAGKNKK